VSFAPDKFVVAKNPDTESALPYLIRLPIDGGLVLKARDVWPRTGRVYCHPVGVPLADDAEILEEVAVRLCARRGAAMIDLVLDRPRDARSQILFTETRGRSAIFWQTQKVTRGANPGGRVPARKVAVGRFEIVVDSREQYGFKFANRDVERGRGALPAGDYAVRRDGAWLAVVERKAMDDLLGSLANGTLVFQLGKLAELPRAAVVVEGGYPALVDAPRTPGGYLTDVLARLQLRYPGVQVVFAGARRYAEEWTFRYLAAALGEWSETDNRGDGKGQGADSAK